MLQLPETPKIAHSPEIVLVDQAGVLFVNGPDGVVGTIEAGAQWSKYVDGDIADDLLVRDEIEHSFEVIEQEPGLLGVIGYFVEESDDTVVHAPNTEQLNSLRNNLLATGIHTGTFVDDESKDGFIDFMDFAQYLANREVPTALTDPSYSAHDIFVHRPGYIVMPEVVFNRFVKAAQRAVRKGDAKMVKRIVTAMDQLTAGGPDSIALDMDASYIAGFYAYFMPPLVAGVRAHLDAAAYKQVAENLREAARNHE